MGLDLMDTQAAPMLTWGDPKQSLQSQKRDSQEELRQVCGQGIVKGQIG